MGLNRKLVETVKGHFAQKSTTELQDIARLRDLDRWSEEAFVAAEEVLAARAAGRAKEPRVPVKDTPPPAPGESLRELVPVLGFLAGGLFGGMIGRALVRAADEISNQPVSFGSNLAWLAVETNDTRSVAVAFGLQRVREALWDEGTAAAYKSEVFVTPPLGDWTLAVSTALFPPDRIETFAKPLVRELSRHFRDAQYFCTHKDAKLHAWARAQKGKFLRGYARDERQSPTVWTEGPQTKTERALGFRFTDAPGAPPVPPHPEDVAVADEGCVLKLAALWSVDPSALDDHFAEPVAGLIGAFPSPKA